MGMRAIPCSIYRGGTSRGVYLRDADLPFSREIRSQILVHLLGSPGAPQVDGLGAGTSSTSKAMIIGTSQRPGIQIESLFAQVSVNAPIVDWGGTCGNLTTAVAPFAIDSGLVKPVEPITEVSVFNINTQRTVVSRVPVLNGRSMSEGDYAVPGVRGTGARIELEFLEPGGALNGRLLPTGKPVEQVHLSSGRSLSVSIVDAGNTLVFCDAMELGLQGTELPSEIEQRQDIMAVLEEIRSIAAVRLGLVSTPDDALSITPGAPKVGFVAPPTSYKTASGTTVRCEQIDLVGRVLSMQTAHRAYMGAGAICTAAAALTEGTIVYERCIPSSRESGSIRIGHPQGVMDVSVRVARRNEETTILSATISRTARCIMEGFAYVPESCFFLQTKPQPAQGATIWRA